MEVYQSCNQSLSIIEKNDMFQFWFYITIILLFVVTIKDLDEIGQIVSIKIKNRDTFF